MLALNNKAPITQNVLGVKYDRERPHKCKFKFEVLASTNLRKSHSNTRVGGAKARIL